MVTIKAVSVLAMMTLKDEGDAAGDGRDDKSAS